jgi:N-acetylmuramoyl-L-alanine amidase
MSYKYTIDHIPKATPYNRRPALKMDAEFIVVHTTGNSNSTAKNERAWLTNLSNNRQASYHLVVDEKEVIEVIPLNENAWHSGDGSGLNSGNRKGVGIEICELNYEKSLENAIELIVGLLKERNWGIDRLKRHFDCSGKNCPRMMNSDGKWTGWYDFLKVVESKLKANSKKEVIVIVNNKQLDDKGILIENRTYVPLRAIGNAIGAKIGWNQQTQDASINGHIVDGIVIEGRTYVPLRVLGEIIGAKIAWDQKNLTASFVV